MDIIAYLRALVKWFGGQNAKLGVPESVRYAIIIGMMNRITPRDKLEELLDQRHWSERMLAVRSGISKSAINAFMLGRNKDMTLMQWVKVAEALGFSLDWLVGMPKRNANDLEPDEQFLLDIYRSVDPAAKAVIRDSAESLARHRFPGGGGE